jgi:hypothetical protein
MTRLAAAVPLAIALAPLLLAGCALPNHPHVTASGPGLPAGARVALAGPGHDSALERGLAQALGETLAARGYHIAAEGDYTLSYSIALRPSAAALATTRAGDGAGDRAGDGAGTDASEVEWLSRPRRTYLLDACRGERLRINIAVFGRGDGPLPYRGVSETDACAVTQQIVARLAAGLVNAAAQAQ